MIEPNRAGRRVAWATVALLAAASAAAETRIDHRVALASGGRFELDADVGSVRVTGTSGSEARVSITARGEDFEKRYEVKFDESPAGLAVRLEKRDSGITSWFRFSSDSVKIEVEVPRDTEVDIDTSGGSIDVSQIERAVSLDTSGGAIVARDVRGAVNADTSGGSIEIDGAGADVIADTSGGSIRLSRVRGTVQADTSGGSIDIDDVGGDVDANTSGGSISIARASGFVHAETSGGTVRAAFARGNSRGASLSTSGGDIEIEIDPGANLDVDASASGGEVVSSIPVEVVGRVTKGMLRGRIGAGGSPLTLRASGGSIRIAPTGGESRSPRKVERD